MASGERTVRVKFDGSSEGLVRAAVEAKAAVKSLADDQKKRQKALNGMAETIGKGAKSLLILGRNAATASAALNVLPVIAGGVFTLAGALPLAVAGGLAMAGAMVAVKLGADGAKRSFDRLTPTLNTLKSNVSASFEKALNPAVDNLKVVLPKLTGGFQEIATAVGGVATRVTSMLKTSSSIGMVQDILSGTARVVQNLGKFFAPVISAFLLIGAVAMPILVNLTSGAEHAGQAFAAFVQHASDTGNLEQWINGAIGAFKTIFGVIRDLGSIVSSVFGAIQDAGGGSFGFLGPLLKTVKEFLNSAEGHDTLVSFFQSLNQVAGVFSRVLGAALIAIAPAIPPLASSFADLATTIGNILVPVIAFLAPVLQNIANFINQNTSWITPLIIAIGLWAAAQWALNIALNANPIGLIVIAIGILIAIVATIITYWGPISSFFVNLWNTVKNAVTVAAQWIWQRLVDAWNFIKGVWSSVAGWFSGVWSGITDGVSAVGDWISGVFDSVVGVVKSIWGGIVSFFTTIWNAIKPPLMILFRVFEFVFLAQVLVIKTIWQALVAVFTAIWNAISGPLTAFGQFVAGVFKSVWDGVVAVWNALVAFFTPIWEGIKLGFQIVGQVISSIWSNVWAGIQAVWSVVVGFFQVIWNAISTAVTFLGGIIGNVFSTAWNIVKGVWSVVSGFFGGIWSSVTSGVSNAAKWVGDRFSDAWNFIKSVWNKVGDFFAGIWSGIGNGLKAALNSVIRLINGAIGKVNTVAGAVGLPGIPEIPYLAKGGTAIAGRSYVVGERGPEIFTPGQTGRVTSNAQSFGGGPREITLNLDLGEGIQQRVQIQIDENGRQTTRRVAAGTGGVAWR